jgi:DNA replication protein DnaC
VAKAFAGAVRQARANDAKHAREATRIDRPTLAERIDRVLAIAAAEPPAADPAPAAVDPVPRMMLDAGVPRRYRAARIDDASALPAESRAMWLASASRLRAAAERGLTIAVLGLCGPGKSHMAAAVLRDWITAGPAERWPRRSAMWTRATDYFMAIKETYQHQSLRTQGRVELDHLRPELLVIDAIEMKSDKPWEDLRLTELICKRDEGMLATILIANYTREGFERAMDPTVVDRVGELIVCNWPSLRGEVLGS